MEEPATSAPEPMHTIAGRLRAWWQRGWLPALLLVAAVILVYQPVWHAGFIWDDNDYVTENRTLRDLDGLRQLWFKVGATPQYYPLVHTTFWLEYHVWGLNPSGFHLVNVLLHATGALLLWGVLKRLQLPGAWLAAAIFALHPVQVESVAWITERKNVLSGVFYFAAALAYLRFFERSDAGERGLRRWGGYILALVLFAAAMLSKTVTCSLPAALLLVRWWKKGRLHAGDILPLAPFFIIGGGLAWLTVHMERNTVGASGPDWSLSLLERCLIAGRALWFYAGKLVWPARLTFVYPRWEVSTAMGWQWLFPFTALAVVAVLWFGRKRIGRGPLVAVLFFAGTLLPALGFINVYPMRFSFVADHFQYLASVGLITLGAAGLYRLGPRQGLAVWPLALAVLAWQQAHLYRDLETLWRDTLARNPACWIAHNNLGRLLLNTGRGDEAMVHFRQTFQIKPDYADAYYNLGTALAGKGQLQEATSCFEKALRINPDLAQAHYNLATALVRLDRPEEAAEQYRSVLRRQPDFTEAHFQLALTLSRLGRAKEAAAQYRQVLKLNPQMTGALNNLAWLLASHPDPEVRNGADAVLLAEQACQLTHYRDAIFVGTLGAAYAAAGRFEEAVTTAKMAESMATAAGDEELARKNQKLAELFLARQPFHESPQPAAPTPGLP